MTPTPGETGPTRVHGTRTAAGLHGKIRTGARLGRYAIVGPIGTGGMGEVYRAHDSELDRDIAIKVLPPALATQPELVARFKREAKAIAALDHPNIVTVHSVEESDGLHFITMQLVHGRKLSEVIPSTGLPLDEFFKLAIPLADAIRSTHERGIIHRDLKPANVMVTADGRIEILDFGIAKLTPPSSPDGKTDELVSDLTVEGRIVGTTAYMSPEQAEGTNVDHRTDIFSLGVLIYELLTGRRPFQGKTKMALLSSIIKDTPRAITDVNPALPRQLWQVTRRCLAKDVAERYQTATEVRDELEGLRTTLPSDVSTGPEPADRPGITSIAVLPLDNLMGDPEQSYFVEGMHEALITRLSKIRALKVISRASVMRYRETDLSSPEIARELGVDAMIEGSVLRAGDLVRISAQLIDGTTDENLWAESYDGDLRNIFALHSDVARSIADQIQVTIAPDEAGRLDTAAAEVEPVAYEEYLKGRHHWNKLTREGWETAVTYFRRSIDNDPSYAPPHAMTSFAYSLLGYYSRMPPTVLHSRALAAADRAVALDASLADAHASLSLVKTTFDWDWSGADRSSLEAVRLDSNAAMVLESRAIFLSWVGRHDEAISVARHAVELDPVAPQVNTSLERFYFAARRYDDAIVQGQKVLDLEPDYRDAHIWLSYAYAKTGRFEDATGESAIVTGYRQPWWPHAWILAAAGHSGEARELLEQQAPAELSGPPIDAYFLAIVLGELGEKDRALAALEQAYHGRTALMSLSNVDPRIDALRDEPRFQDLQQRMGFPQ